MTGIACYTACVAQSGSELESTFKQAWALLMQNLIIVVPGLVISLGIFIPIVFMVVAGIGAGVAIAAVAQSANTAHTYSGLIAIGLVFCAIVFIIAILFVMVMAVAQTTFITGMAGGIWERGSTTFTDGWNAFREHGFEVFYAFLLLLVIGIVAIILAPFTLLLSLAAYLVFFLYVTTFIIIGKRSATEAISESCRLAVRDFWPTVIIAAVSLGVSFVAALCGMLFGHALFFAGGLVAMIFPIAGRTYIALVIVGHYRKLAL